MFNSTIHRKNLNQLVTRFAILAVLLPSMNVLAASPATSTNAGIQNTSAARSTATSQKAISGNEWQQAKATKRQSANSASSNTPRAYKDDYEKILVRVGSAHDTQPVWLGKHYHKDSTKLSKVIWLSGKGGGSD